MSKIFEKNISSLVKIDPQLATKLLSIPTHKNFEVVQQGDDTINLNIIDMKNNYPVYEQDFLSYLQTQQEEFKKYSRFPILFFYGIGNGIFTKLLFANPSHQNIFVYEPNIEILYIALHIVDFSQEIETKRIHFIDPKEYTFAKAMKIFENPDIQVYSKLYQLHIHSPYYNKFFTDDILRINQINLRAIKQAINNLGNDVKDTLIGIEHHVKNTPEMIKNIQFRKLAQINKQMSNTAIIISTGPSLAKQLPLLKKVKDYATLIAVDASMPILEKHGIKPDFVVSLERVPATGKFFKTTSKEFQKDIVMVHASLQHREVLDNSHGKKCLVMRPFYFTKSLGLNPYGFLGIGMSAANMAYELAYVLKHKNIVLIGQDLAYGIDGKSHASGHVYGEDEVKFKETDEYVTAYGGEGTIRTTQVWNMFRNFFERDIELTKKEGVITINATEGGARIEGAIEKPFKNVVEEILKNSKKKKPVKVVYPNEEEVNKYLLKAHKKYKEILDYGEKLQKRIERLFLKVAKECEKLEKLNEKKELEKINFDKLLKLSNEIDKIKTKIETKKFFSMYGEVVQSELVHQEMELAKIQVQNSATEIEKKAKLIDWIMKHKYWLFSLAGSINAERIAISRAIDPLEEELKSRNLPFTPVNKVQ